VLYSNHGTSEVVMRSQFKAWSEYMAGAGAAPAAARGAAAPVPAAAQA
jgi:hypothetical protein